MLSVDLDSSNEKPVEIENLLEWEELKTITKEIFIRYVIDEEAVYDEILVAEYPNGGRDCEYVLVEPEVGHFDITFSDGTPVSFKMEVPDYVLKDGSTFTEDLVIRYWKRLPPERVAELEEEQRKRQEKADAERDFLETGHERVSFIEETQDDIVLLLADIVGGGI